MRPQPRTPEELETLLEDAFLTRDPQAVCDLFEEGSVLVAGKPAQEARGGEGIAQLAGAILESDRRYIAGPQRIVQARDTAVVIANGGIHVVRRGSNGGWRYAIALLALDHANPKEEEEEK